MRSDTEMRAIRRLANEMARAIGNMNEIRRAAAGVQRNMAAIQSVAATAEEVRRAHRAVEPLSRQVAAAASPTVANMAAQSMAETALVRQKVAVQAASPIVSTMKMALESAAQIRALRSQIVDHVATPIATSVQRLVAADRTIRAAQESAATQVQASFALAMAAARNRTRESAEWTKAVTNAKEWLARTDVRSPSINVATVAMTPALSGTRAYQRGRSLTQHELARYLSDLRMTYRHVAGTGKSAAFLARTFTTPAATALRRMAALGELIVDRVASHFALANKTEHHVLRCDPDVSAQFPDVVPSCTFAPLVDAPAAPNAPPRPWVTSHPTDALPLAA